MQLVPKKPSQYSVDRTTLDGKTKKVQITRANTNLKVCPVFDNLILSKKGFEYLDDIHSRLKLGSWLTRALGIGGVATVFIGGTTLNAEVTVKSTDWIMLAEGMRDVSKITRRKVEDIAGMAVIELQDDEASNDEIKFFRAIYDGCIP